AVVGRDPSVLFVNKINRQQVVANQTVRWFPNRAAIFASDNSSAIADGHRPLFGNERHTRERQAAETHYFFPVLAAVAGAQDRAAIANRDSEILVDEGNCIEMCTRRCLL